MVSTCIKCNSMVCVLHIHGLCYSPGGHIGQQMPLSGSAGCGCLHNDSKHCTELQIPSAVQRRAIDEQC